MYRLKSTFAIALVVGISGLIYEFVTTGNVSGWGIGQGIALGILLGVLEGSSLTDKMRKLPFVITTITKTVLYVGIVICVFVSSTLFAGYMQGKTIDDFTAEISSFAYYHKFIYAFIVFLLVVFFRQLNHLLGQGVLLRYISGRYHHPRRQERIFMFLDLKSSTSIAEKLGPDAYSSFLQSFYYELDDAIVETKGEVYQYVGDEIVMVWPTPRGIANNSCVRFFFLVNDKVEELKSMFLKRYGVSPEFKAGMHHGEVLVTEIGSFKKDIAYHGDPINTAARICATCNQADRRFLISADLLRLFPHLDDDYYIEPMGMFNLKGKKNVVGLFSIEERNHEFGHLNTQPNETALPS
jgi:adenylate cyclase